MTGRPAAVALAFVLHASAAAEDALVAAGREAFTPCRSCHALEAPAAGLPGPDLAGLIGRPVAGLAGFSYSPALRAAGDGGLVWDRARLERFLADPEGMFPGMWMSYPGIGDAGERRALAAFIAAHDRSALMD